MFTINASASSDDSALACCYGVLRLAMLPLSAAMQLLILFYCISFNPPPPPPPDLHLTSEGICRETLVFDIGTVKLADFGLSKVIPL